MTRFTAIDVETANESMASICQIGGVVFENGVEVDSFSTLIDPEDYFCGWNVDVHGITEEDVAGAPTFADYLPELVARIDSGIVACHTHFDRVSLSRACERIEVSTFGCAWLDTARVARRIWPGEEGGYGLAALAERLDITFEHHDALEDARAAGGVLLAAMQTSGLDLDGCFARCRQPIDLSRDERLRLEAGDGPLADHRIVFTGSLCIARADAAKLANSFGAGIDPGVTKKTTMLVVGDQDLSKLNGSTKSGKHRKAETLIAQGQMIRILAESDFARLCDREYL